MYLLPGENSIVNILIFRELRYMRGKFTQMFHQLDAIEGKINNLKNVAEWEAQKAVYSKDVLKIHLATHANASANPWIAFADQKLGLHELYTSKNQAELVVLSACNTNMGTIESGEGVFSLARGFFYSGANSVVASLWNANSKSSSEVLSDFYKNLKDGQTKSEALRNAKITYLKSRSLSDASPYYWACFVVMGDNQPIAFPTSYGSVFLWIISLMCVIAFLFFTYRKKRLQISGNK